MPTGHATTAISASRRGRRRPDAAGRGARLPSTRRIDVRGFEMVSEPVRQSPASRTAPPVTSGRHASANRERAGAPLLRISSGWSTTAAGAATVLPHLRRAPFLYKLYIVLTLLDDSGQDELTNKSSSSSPASLEARKTRLPRPGRLRKARSCGMAPRGWRKRGRQRRADGGRGVQEGVNGVPGNQAGVRVVLRLLVLRRQPQAHCPCAAEVQVRPAAAAPSAVVGPLVWPCCRTGPRCRAHEGCKRAGDARCAGAGRAVLAADRCRRRSSS